MLNLLLLCSAAAAQDHPGSGAAEFLNVDPGARPGSMGGAFAAIAGDISGLPYNPSSLAGLGGAAATVHHTNWYQHTFQEYAALGIPVGDETAVAASVGYIHYGPIEGYDAADNPLGEFSPSNTVLSISAARQWGSSISFGVTGKYFQEDFETGSYSGWALDIGAQYHWGSVAVGVAALNLGPQITAGNSSYALPRRFRAGICIALNRLLITTFDAQLEANGAGTMYQGAEYAVSPNLFLRAGYRHLGARNGDNGGSPWTAGGGLIISSARFDYNYTPGGILGDIHRFTMTFGK